MESDKVLRCAICPAKLNIYLHSLSLTLTLAHFVQINEVFRKKNLIKNLIILVFFHSFFFSHSSFAIVAVRICQHLKRRRSSLPYMLLHSLIFFSFYFYFFFSLKMMKRKENINCFAHGGEENETFLHLLDFLQLTCFSCH